MKERRRVLSSGIPHPAVWKIVAKIVFLKVEAARSSKMPVTIYQSVRPQRQ
jgi:hypothetical protein